ncbi:hypothetical protein ACQ4LK_23490, partial [Bacillus pumilus]
AFLAGPDRTFQSAGHIQRLAIYMVSSMRQERQMGRSSKQEQQTMKFACVCLLYTSPEPTRPST